MAEITHLRQRRDEVETRMDEIDSGLIDFSVGSLRRERNDLNAQLEALETLGDGGPRLTVTLDDYASFLVRRTMTTQKASSPADVVNGALAFTCGEDDDHDWPEEMHKAAERRQENVADRCSGQVVPFTGLAGHSVMVQLSPVQMRMFMQIADDSEGGSMADLARRELGQHVALHLECYHGHDKDEALTRWEREGKAVA